MDDEDFAEIRRTVGENSALMLDALGTAEVQEALESWSDATWDMIRALERAGVPRHSIAGFVGGGIIDSLQQIAER